VRLPFVDLLQKEIMAATFYCQYGQTFFCKN